LGATFPGILGSDRLPAYLKYVVGQRQFCWAHVTRNVLSALDPPCANNGRDNLPGEISVGAGRVR
jgi:hypothetical protein